MMLFELFAVLAAVTVSLAATVNTMPGTPPGFQPATTTPLVVLFINGIDATGGKQVGKDVAKQPPVLASAQRLPGTSFAVMMVDLDVPTSSPPQTTTLLHWMQSGLTQSQTQTTFNTTLGTQQLYAFDIPGAVQAAAPYIGPAPPARTPLNHRYTLIVVDTTGIDPNNMSILMKAAQSRIGFNPLQVLTQTNLQNKVVAGDYFRVTSPGPAKDGGTPPQAPPSQAPPTQAPPTQAPPTQAPPTQAPPTQAPSVPSIPSAPAPAPAPVQPPTVVPPAPIIPAPVPISPPPPVVTPPFPAPIIPAPSTIPATVPVGGGFGSGTGTTGSGSTPSSPFTFGTTSAPSSPFSFGSGTTPSRSAGTTQHKSTGVLLAFTLIVVILTSL